MSAGQAAARGVALTWGILFVLAGCAVGPDFRTPPAPAVDAYRKDALPQATVAANLQAQAMAEQSTARSLELVRTQYRNGAASYLQLLDATRQYQLARIGLIQARA